MNKRDSNGRFQKGNSAGGRTAGSKNKITQEIRETFLSFLHKNAEGMQEAFDKLSEREKFDVLLRMTKYVLPTLKAIEMKEPEPKEEPEEIDISMLSHNTIEELLLATGRIK